MAATCRVRVEQLFSVLTSDLVIGGGGGYTLRSANGMDSG